LVKRQRKKKIKCGFKAFMSGYSDPDERAGRIRG